MWLLLINLNFIIVIPDEMKIIISGIVPYRLPIKIEIKGVEANFYIYQFIKCFFAMGDVL